jgi:biotin carboxyl carrier protein
MRQRGRRREISEGPVPFRPFRGDEVEEGDPVVVLEAMKMETNVNAGSDGVIKEVFVAAGDMVEAGASLVRCE